METKRVRLADNITEEFIDEIRSRLEDNLRIRRTLPGQGRLHIDRNLPFLCIYRRPESDSDQGSDQLVTGEASYLVISSEKRFRAGLSSLVRTIAGTLSQSEGAFLIIEIWADREPVPIMDPQNGRTAPAFRLLVPPNQIPVETVEAVESALRHTVISRNRGKVTIEYTQKPWPGEFPGIMSVQDITRYNCFLIGIEISPIYRDPNTLEIFPLVLKKLQRSVSLAIKKGAFEFAMKRTNLRAESYRALGRRAMVKAVWEVDSKLAEISQKFDFLLLVTPVNIEQSYQKFKKSGFEKEPLFYYRPIAFDPSLLKRKLYEIPFDRIEDPSLSRIFHLKLIELERKFSMIRDRNTRNFIFENLQLFGEPDRDLTGLAHRILERLPAHSRESGGSKRVNASAFTIRAGKEIEYYRQFHPQMASTVTIRDDITGLMVSHGNLSLGKKVSISHSRVEALIQHEIGTHVLTYVNGMNQPFKQLYCGLAGSEELQEGLAVLSEYLVDGLTVQRFRLLAARVVASDMLIEGATFIDTFRELNQKYGFSQRIAYIITSRIYRGGGFTKDAVYLRGFCKLLEYVRNGGDLMPLFIGKISLQDIPLVNELRQRGVLKPLLLTPRYLENPSAIERLDELKQGKQIFNLM